MIGPDGVGKSALLGLIAGARRLQAGEIEVFDGDRPETVVNQDIVDKLNVPASYIEKKAEIELEELEQRRACYLADRPRVDITGCTAIVIDDGLATGATM